MKKKGNVTFYLVFLFMAIFIVIITGVFAPLGTRFGTEFYKAGDGILEGSKDTIASISNEAIRNEINASLTEAQANQQLNIQTNASIYKYAWVLLIGVTALGLFLYSRRLNEIQGLS